MNLRSWFHLGLSLLGVFYIAKSFIEIPAVFAMVVASTESHGFPPGMRILVSGLGPFFFQLFAGVFLVRRARGLSEAFAETGSTLG